MRVLFHASKNIPGAPVLRKFANAACQAVPSLRKEGDIHCIFISDPEIRKMKKKYFGIDRTTDVIAFNYDPPPFGDIFISMDTAKRQAQAGNYPVRKELAILILHGLLHLAGHEDTKAGERKKMFLRQKQILNKIAPRLAPPDLE